MKRFWKQAEAMALPDGRWAVGLDGRTVKTPEKLVLAAPTQAAAALLAAEWAAQGEEVSTATMPLTRLVNVALDRAPLTRAAMVDEFVRYAGNDLLCYRAATPQRLAMTQDALWGPPLGWVETAFGAALETTTGLEALDHDPASLEALRTEAQALDDVRLTILSHATALTGSAVLALALVHRAMVADAVIAAFRVDETFQNETWGTDFEAEAAASALRAEIEALEKLLLAL
jgi:chaperone required for assembly of F1-ATPase